jgi:uncharacterized membrane protein
VEQTGEVLIIHIPPNTKSVINYISVFAPIIFAGIAALFFLPSILSHPRDGFFRSIPLGFIVFFFIALPIILALKGMYRLKKEFEQITVTKAFLRVEALKQGKRITTEIPVSELEDLVAPTTQGVMNSIEVPGMKKVPLGDTGTPRMPDGRPVPRFLLSLMKIVGSKGIIARSDKTMSEFAGGLDEAEVAWIFALIRKTIVE